MYTKIIIHECPLCLKQVGLMLKQYIYDFSRLFLPFLTTVHSNEIEIGVDVSKINVGKDEVRI